MDEKTKNIIKAEKVNEMGFTKTKSGFYDKYFACKLSVKFASLNLVKEITILTDVVDYEANSTITKLRIEGYITKHRKSFYQKSKKQSTKQA